MSSTHSTKASLCATREPPPRSVSDEWRAGPFSKLFFSWVFPLLRVGAKRPLLREDLGSANRHDEVEQHALRLEACLATGKARQALRAAFSRHMLKGAICKGVGDAVNYLSLWAVKCIITHAESVLAWPSRPAFSYFVATATTGPRVVDFAVLSLIMGPIVSGVSLSVSACSSTCHLVCACGFPLTRVRAFELARVRQPLVLSLRDDRRAPRTLRAQVRPLSQAPPSPRRRRQPRRRLDHRRNRRYSRAGPQTLV